ncbi:MAG: hypothetical protein GXP08_03445 [Gammaproteobacteria bacterium]|nr:hypothetical protein [Gammaproteobacteria bacterium]
MRTIQAIQKIMPAVFLTLGLNVSSVSADQLWNNGDTDGSTLGWGQSSSTLDDFYVPGGGWWINGVETIGVFINPTTVTEVDVAIWSHDMDENEPNESIVYPLTGVSFETTATGRIFSDREEIKIQVNFDNTYLKGQRYYWIELTVRDQDGISDFRFLARQGVSHEPAWTHFGLGSISASEELYGSQLDLSYALYGNPVESRFRGLPSDFTLDLTGEKTKQLVFKITDKSAARRPLIADEIVAPCPKGTSRSPFEMPIYDDDGHFVVDYKTVWFCIRDDLQPEG